MSHPDFRILLKEEYAKRVAKRPAYSQRAFARDLQLTPGFLNLVLQGKKNFSAETALAVGTRLLWDETKLRTFVAMAALASAKTQALRNKVLDDMLEHAAFKESFEEGGSYYEELGLGRFEQVSQWYFFALLELVSLDAFQPDSKWIAQALGISVMEAELAVHRLIKLDLLYFDGTKLKRRHEDYGISEISSEAIRRYHKQVLQKAEESIDQQKVERREFTGLTLAFDSAEMNEAKKMIREFQAKFLRRFSAKAQKAKSVYQLNVQFFRLDKIKGGEE